MKKLILKTIIFCAFVGCTQARTIKHSGNNRQFCNHLITDEEATLAGSADKIVAAILQKNTEEILNWLHPNRGIAMETDRVMKLRDVKKEFKEKGRYYERLFDSGKHRIRLGSPDFVSVRDELAAYVQNYGEPSFDIAWTTSNCKYVDVYLSWQNFYPDQAFKLSLSKHERQWRLIEIIFRQDF